MVLLDESLSDGSVELYLRCPNLIALCYSDRTALGHCPSLLRIDLTGCPKLESIPRLAFFCCEHLVSVVFGEHSSITGLGVGAFQHCYALTSITLPDKLSDRKDLFR